MRYVRRVCGLAALLMMTPLFAEQQPSHRLQVIPKSYISPGASGSIGTSERIEQYNLYGGQRLPNIVQRYEQRDAQQSVEHRGSIQQRIEYPGGHSVQQYPGQSSQSNVRSR